MNDWNLRRATNADRPALMLLVADSLAEFGLLPDLEGSEADLKDLEATYDGSGGLFLVAEREGLLGCGGYLVLEDGTAKIRKMYVRAGHRGQGLGHALLARLVEEARARGVQRLILETMERMTAARALYERFGFRLIEGEPESCRCDLVYALELG